eukprot:360363-Chlamydomonas_euryale.AAC.11
MAHGRIAIATEQKITALQQQSEDTECAARRGTGMLQFKRPVRLGGADPAQPASVRKCHLDIRNSIAGFPSQLSYSSRITIACVCVTTILISEGYGYVRYTYTSMVALNGEWYPPFTVHPVSDDRSGAGPSPTCRAHASGPLTHAC